MDATTATVPDEVVARITHAYWAAFDPDGSGTVYPYFENEVRAVLTAAAAAGFVLVPGPVDTEYGVAWTNDQGDRLNYPEADAETARKRVNAIAQILPGADPVVVSHLVTDWLPVDGGSTDGGGKTEASDA